MASKSFETRGRPRPSCGRSLVVPQPRNRSPRRRSRQRGGCHGVSGKRGRGDDLCADPVGEGWWRSEGAGRSVRTSVSLPAGLLALPRVNPNRAAGPRRASDPVHMEGRPSCRGQCLVVDGFIGAGGGQKARAAGSSGAERRSRATAGGHGGSIRTRGNRAAGHGAHASGEERRGRSPA